ncbi:MAG: helix-turn-helix transcriptional regulator [Vallitaleaceae bacterium]|nr:helix-turn-helix transcriptional regulator [Vallitaleaceae bacterium]
MFQLSYIGYNYHENSDFVIHRPSGSGNYLFLLFKSEVDLILNEELQRLSPGAMILFDPHFPQFYHNRVDGFTNDWLHIEAHEFEDFIKGLKIPVNTPFYLYPSETVRLMIHDIEKEYLRLDFAYEESIHSQIMALFIFLARNFHQKDKHQNDPYMEELENQFRQIRANIISRHWESWTVDSMASLSGHSRSRFSYLYHHFFRISPKEDLILERIQMAKYLLKNSNLTISQVSQKVGYDNLYHFSKLFKKNTGLSPSRYRT